jgi:cyclase
MQRRTFIHHTSLAAGALLLPARQLLATLYNQPVYTLTPLRNNVGIFTERGGTIAWCINKKGIAVVDTQFPEQAGHLIAELKKQSSKPFKYLINTHHHGDHSGGNIAFKGLAKKVVAHANSLTNQKMVAEKQKTLDKQLLPDTTFTDTWQGKLGRERIKIYYFGAGHTNGDSLVHFEHANIVHMGDLVFNRRYPFIDKSSGASIKNWIIILQKARATFNNETIYVFGHAFDSKKVTGAAADLTAFEDMLTKLLRFVEAEVRAGKTKEEILKAKQIPGVTEWQGDGIERGLAAAYTEVTEEK